MAASNAKGIGSFSALNSAGVLAQTPPLAPTTSPVGGSLTTESQLEISWAFLTGANQNGGSEILSYGLSIDDGAGGDFVQVVGELPATAPYTLNSQTITTAINSGLSYRLTYKAYNVHGWGPDSPIATVIAATLPDPPLAPTLSVVGSDVQITWAAPTNTGGTSVAITAYRIEILLTDGTIRQDTVNCDGT